MLFNSKDVHVKCCVRENPTYGLILELLLILVTQYDPMVLNNKFINKTGEKTVKMSQ